LARAVASPARWRWARSPWRVCRRLAAAERTVGSCHWSPAAGGRGARLARMGASHSPQCVCRLGREAGHCEGEPRTPPPGPQQVASSAVLHSHPRGGAHKHRTKMPMQGSNSQSSQGRFGGLHQGERPHQGEECHQDDIRGRLGG
jgi:hypothetical protein